MVYNVVFYELVIVIHFYVYVSLLYDLFTSPSESDTHAKTV